MCCAVITALLAVNSASAQNPGRNKGLTKSAPNRPSVAARVLKADVKVNGKAAFRGLELTEGTNLIHKSKSGRRLYVTVAKGKVVAAEVVDVSGRRETGVMAQQTGTTRPGTLRPIGGVKTRVCIMLPIAGMVCFDFNPDALKDFLEEMAEKAKKESQ
jgi:hypothetical protein